MVGEIFEGSFYEVPRFALELSTMVGENFEIYFPQMARIYFKCNLRKII